MPSMLALIANNRTCPCGRPYDAHAHHVHTCIRSNKTRAHNLIQDCLISLASDTDFGATKRVPTIEVDDQQLRADLYLPRMVVGGVGRGLCVDVAKPRTVDSAPWRSPSFNLRPRPIPYAYHSYETRGMWYNSPPSRVSTDRPPMKSYATTRINPWHCLSGSYFPQ